jgi:hypothetical protein
MNVRELIAELEKYDPELPCCWPDQNEDSLHPTLITGAVVTTGPWCDEFTNNLDDPDHDSEYVEIG